MILPTELSSPAGIPSHHLCDYIQLKGQLGTGLTWMLRQVGLALPTGLRASRVQKQKPGLLWLRPGTSTCHFLCIFPIKASHRAGDYTRWCIPADWVYLGTPCHRLPQSISPYLQYLLSPQAMVPSPSPASILVLVSNTSTPLWMETLSST